MPDVPNPEPCCEYCITNGRETARLRSGFKTDASFTSHRSYCKKQSMIKQSMIKKRSAPAGADQSASDTVKPNSNSAKRSRATVGRGLPHDIGATVNVIFGMRPDGQKSIYTAAVIVDVARVEQDNQSNRYAALVEKDEKNCTSTAATCEYVYQVDYKDEAMLLKLPGKGKINPLCELV